jgi:hypothetical protein
MAEDKDKAKLNTENTSANELPKTDAVSDPNADLKAKMAKQEKERAKASNALFDAMRLDRQSQQV